MLDALILGILFCAGAALYRFRAPIVAALRRFDARNAARQEEDFRARFEADAHYRHTLRLVDEQVEAVSALRISDTRTGILVPRYVFLGETYATREEAEAARRSAVVAQARAFYVDMDTAALRRGAQTREN
jgi:uncharacterized protein (DUF1684 family)